MITDNAYISTESGSIELKHLEFHEEDNKFTFKLENNEEISKISNFLKFTIVVPVAGLNLIDCKIDKNKSNNDKYTGFFENIIQK